MRQTLLQAFLDTIFLYLHDNMLQEENKGMASDYNGEVVPYAESQKQWQPNIAEFICYLPRYKQSRQDALKIENSAKPDYFHWDQKYSKRRVSDIGE